MRLVITEKPSMGRDVAAALGATTRREGYMEGNDTVVTWCVGHLVELAQPEDYDEGLKQWRKDTLPMIPPEFKYAASAKTKDQYKVIKGLLARPEVKTVVNATDAGREGELIFWLVFNLAGCKKPVERLWISSLTRDAILTGFRKLRPAAEYQGLRESAYARMQADWLVGLNATRAQTICARMAGHSGVFSLGRVQTPTLALIVERDREIANFVPTNYYQVVAVFEAEAGRYAGVWFSPETDRFDHKDAAEGVAFKVAGKPGVVERVEKKETKERAPLLYDLTALQRAANARHSFSAAKTLELAQSLYEKKVLTYPRTSSRHLSTDVYKEIRGHVEAANVGPYAPFAAAVLAKDKPALGSRHVDDKKVTDHHAIITTRLKADLASLSGDERKVYDMVVRRFLAAFYEDALIERTSIVTLVEGERFKTSGSVVVRAGWREVDPPGREDRKKASGEGGGEGGAEGDDEESEEPLPRVRAKEGVKTLSAEALAKQTKAPPRYTEASLLAAMETAGKKIDDEELRLAMKDSGLGTPATRAATIEKLLKLEYVRRDKKALVATEKGATLIEALAYPLLKSAELTGMWEQKLSRMARGDYRFDAFMGEVRSMVEELVPKIFGTQMRPGSGGGGVPGERPEGAFDCPKCKYEGRDGFLVERSGKGAKFFVCSKGRDACGYISDVPKNAKQRKALLETRCPACQGGMRLRVPKEKDKKTALSCAKYPECRGVRWFGPKNELEEPRAPAEYGPPCEKCGKRTVKRQSTKSSRHFLSCSGWKSDGTGCDAPVIWLDGEGRPEQPRELEYGPACAGCGGKTVKRGPFKNESYFWGCVNWKSDGSGCKEPPVWVEKDGSERAPSETGPACEKCGTATVKRGPAKNGSYFWSCPKWRRDGTGCDAAPVWIEGEPAAPPEGGRAAGSALPREAPAAHDDGMGGLPDELARAVRYVLTEVEEGASKLEAMDEAVQEFGVDEEELVREVNARLKQPKAA